MKSFKFLLLGLLLSVTVMAYSQGYSFKQRQHSKAPKDKIAFKVLGISSEKHADRLELKLKSLPGIATANISYLYKCRIEVTDSVSAENIRDALLEAETDFYFPSLDVSNPDLYKNLEKYRDAMIPDDFPKKSSEMNQEEEKAYKMAVYEWGKRYPQKYGMLVELGYVSE